jgi:hypothetical protein
LYAKYYVKVESNYVFDLRSGEKGLHSGSAVYVAEVRRGLGEGGLSGAWMRGRRGVIAEGLSLRDYRRGVVCVGEGLFV